MSFRSMASKHCGLCRNVDKRIFFLKKNHHVIKRILHELSFNINLYGTHSGNDIKLAKDSLYTFPKLVFM